MTQDELIFSLISGLVGGRVYPDIGKQGTAVPYITHQDVGGDAINFMDGAMPGKSNTRLQVNVWSATRAEAKAIARQVEQILRAAPALSTTVLGSAMTTHDAATNYHGTYQHFSIWTDT